MAGRSDRTRDVILDAAERLYGTHGLMNVSLRQVRIEAEQGNTAAVHYHFGDRDGILRGLRDRHLPRQREIHERILAAQRGRPSRRQLVEAFVRPVAEYIALGPSERAWIKISADLLSNPQLAVATLRDRSTEGSADAAMSLYERVAERIGPEVAGERVWAMGLTTYHLVADRARVIDDPAAKRTVTPEEVFITNLVDMIDGALGARVTPPPPQPKRRSKVPRA